VVLFDRYVLPNDVDDDDDDDDDEDEDEDDGDKEEEENARDCRSSRCALNDDPRFAH